MHYFQGSVVIAEWDGKAYFGLMVKKQFVRYAGEPIENMGM